MISVNPTTGRKRNLLDVKTAAKGFAKHNGKKVRRQRKTVRFAAKNPIFTIPNHDEDSREDIWYSGKDFESFMRERVMTVHLLKLLNQGDDEKSNNMLGDSNDYCSRGLEPYQSNDLNRQICTQRKLHQDTVLAEQKRQKELGQCDAERIQQLASHASELATLRAQHLALLDAEEVHNMKNLDRKSDSSSNCNSKKNYLDVITSNNDNQSLQSQLFSRSTLTTSLAGSVLNMNYLQNRQSLLRPQRNQVDVATLKEWNARFLSEMSKKNNNTSAVVPAPVSQVDNNTATMGTFPMVATSAATNFNSCGVSTTTTGNRRSLVLRNIISEIESITDMDF